MEPRPFPVRQCLPRKTLKGNHTLNEIVDVDVLIVGAGPAGLCTACACEDRGLTSVVVDRAGLAQSFSEYPHNLQFFSPPGEMEIGGVPLPVAGGLKPTRETYLAYLRGVARSTKINLQTWTAITACKRQDNGSFLAATKSRPTGLDGPRIHACGIVLATGVWNSPNRLGVPGEEMPHIIHELADPTPYFDCGVVVIGGGNSAVGGALTLMEAGANVALSMRRPPKNYRCGLRPFVKRDLGFAVDEGRIRLHDNTVVREILPDRVILEPVRYTGSEDLTEGQMSDYENTGEQFELPARFVFALIGHRPDETFLRDIIGLDLRHDGRPACDLGSWETPARNIFLAGSLADPSIDIILKLREQAADVVDTLATRLRNV